MSLVPLSPRGMGRRFDNRNSLYLFRDTMLKLISSNVLEYKTLTEVA
jgi:hypothetical protein